MKTNIEIIRNKIETYLEDKGYLEEKVSNNKEDTEIYFLKDNVNYNGEKAYKDGKINILFYNKYVKLHNIIHLKYYVKNYKVNNDNHVSKKTLTWYKHYITYTTISTSLGINGNALQDLNIDKLNNNKPYNTKTYYVFRDTIIHYLGLLKPNYDGFVKINRNNDLILKRRLSSILYHQLVYSLYYYYEKYKVKCVDRFNLNEIIQ